MKLTNKIYNLVKYFTTIFLPAVGALYYGLAQIWGFQNPEDVNGTINLIIVFLGVLIGISSRQYKKATHDGYDGDLIVSEVDGEKYLGLGVNESVEAMQSKDEVRLRVIEK
jgi:hypothetical protein